MCIFRQISLRRRATLVLSLIVVGYCCTIALTHAQSPYTAIAKVRITDINYTDFAIPPAAEIEKIVAEVYDSPSGYADVPQFEVPDFFYPQITELLKVAVVDPEPVLTYHEIGSMRILSKNGSVRRVCWYWQGKGSLKFSVQGVRYYRSTDEVKADEALKLDAILRAGFQWKTGLDSTRVRSAEQ
jgi:hypothetical protein